MFGGKNREVRVYATHFVTLANFALYFKDKFLTFRDKTRNCLTCPSALQIMKGLSTIALLLLSNVFMTFAWYGHLKFQHLSFFKKTGLFGIILASWLIAFLEYCFMVPANRIGYQENGGPFSLLHLKVIQEVITLVVFVLFTLVFFKNETLKWNHFVGFVFLVLAVYFIRK